MKKTYSKPEIMFERFAVSTNIAGDCTPPYMTGARDICGIPDNSGMFILFNTNVDGQCNLDGDINSTTNDGMCYHNPSLDNNLFNS